MAVNLLRSVVSEVKADHPGEDNPSTKANEEPIVHVYALKTIVPMMLRYTEFSCCNVALRQNELSSERKSLAPKLGS